MSLKPQPVNFIEKWLGIEEIVGLVLTMGSIKRTTWNERFSDIYSVCIAHPDPLADKLYSETKLLLENHVRDLCVKVSAQGEESLLKEYYDHWQQYSKGASYLNSLYTYLNTQHIQRNKMTDADITYGSISMDSADRLLEIGELALEIWQKDMIMPLRIRLVGVLLSGIKQDRMGSPVDSPKSTIRGVIGSFVELDKFKLTATMQLYEQIFEGDLIKETGEFYRSEAANLLQGCTVPQYMEKVIARLEDEQLRATLYLPPSSHKKVEREVLNRMVSDHLETLHAETPTMVSKETEESNSDLANMYTLLRSVPNGITCLVKNMQDHIEQKVQEAISNLKGDNIQIQFVENLLAVHGKYKQKIKILFSSDKLFTIALDQAFKTVVNKRIGKTCRSPELLAKYCDTLLKKSTKGLNESEVEDKLGQSVIMFRYIDDKDVYQKFYSRHLAKRLIHQQSHSMDAEEAMINRLKHACGYEYTSKLHRMYTDMSVNTGHNQKFQQYVQDKGIELGINFSVNVLQAGAWPLGQVAVTNFTVPQELEKSVQYFEKFYSEHFTGRKLTWLHHLCQGELKVNFTKRTYLITLSSYQMAMLLMFEKVDSVSCSELKEHTGLNEEQFGKFLQSLVDCKLLNLDTDTDEAVSPTTNVSLNLSYTNKRTKFKIQVNNPKEVVQETEQTHKAVEEDRKLYLRAAIVRIMKARKRLKHNLLIQEVINQSKARFTPVISMIKKCIEVLIEQQYIERANDTADEYSYVA